MFVKDQPRNIYFNDSQFLLPAKRVNKFLLVRQMQRKLETICL